MFHILKHVLPPLLAGSRGNGEANPRFRAGSQAAPRRGIPAGQRRQHHLRRRALLGAEQRDGQGHQRPSLVKLLALLFCCDNIPTYTIFTSLSALFSF